MIGLLVVAFIVEPTLIGLAPDVGKFGPTSGAPNGILGVETFDDGGDDDLLPSGAAVAVMIAWVGAAFAAGAALLERRDLV